MVGSGVFYCPDEFRLIEFGPGVAVFCGGTEAGPVQMLGAPARLPNELESAGWKSRGQRLVATFDVRVLHLGSACSNNTRLISTE